LKRQLAFFAITFHLFIFRLNINKTLMYRKRLKSFYELLEAGNNKKLIIEVDKLIASTPVNSRASSGHSHAHSGACCHGPPSSSAGSKKKAALHTHDSSGYDEYSSVIISKALKSLALVRTGRKQEADKLIDELLDSYTSDENALNIIMQYCKETHQLSKIVSFYENAVNKCESNSSLVGTPEHEEILSSLFYAYVRNRDFVKQQQIALKLYKQTNRMMFCFWNAASYVLLSKKPEKNDDTVLNHQAEQKRALYLQLGEKILQKAYEENKMEYNGEFLLYLNILEERKKYADALKIVDSVDEANLSKIGQVDFKVRKRIEYAKKLNNFQELRKLCEEYLKVSSNMDDWLHFLDYLNAVVNLLKDKNNQTDEFIEDVLGFFNVFKSRIENVDTSTAKSDKAQAPYLARIEFLNRIFKLNKEKTLQLNAAKFNEALLKEYLSNYICMFSSKPGFFYDFVYFKDLFQDFKLDEFILDLLKSLHDKNRPFKSIKSIYTCLSYWQMHRFFGKQTNMNQQELLQLTSDLETMYVEGLEYGKDLLATAFQYADEFIVLSSHIRYDLYKRFKDDSNNLLLLIVNLKQALVHSPSNYQLKLLLLNLYSHLGSYESIQKMYDSMDIKNIQNYSTANLLLVHNLRLGALGASIATYDRMNQFFTSNLFDTANFLVFILFFLTNS
jgi:N-terminal acetyltransferase B complex non-catalytic subunit